MSGRLGGFLSRRTQTNASAQRQSERRARQREQDCSAERIAGTKTCLHDEPPLTTRIRRSVECHANELRIMNHTQPMRKTLYD